MPCHAVSVPCHDHAFLKATSQGHGTARHGRCMSWRMLNSIGRPETRLGYLPALISFCYHEDIHEGCYQKHTNRLNCRTSSSENSGYHADFHERQDTVRKWQGHGTARERQGCGMGTAWARYGMCELILIRLEKYYINIVHNFCVHHADSHEGHGREWQGHGMEYVN
jgi:hypothetical protein